MVNFEAPRPDAPGPLQPSLLSSGEPGRVGDNEELIGGMNQ